jgi:hypothetical protein
MVQDFRNRQGPPSGRVSGYDAGSFMAWKTVLYRERGYSIGHWSGKGIPSTKYRGYACTDRLK